MYLLHHYWQTIVRTKISENYGNFEIVTINCDNFYGLYVISFYINAIKWTKNLTKIKCHRLINIHSLTFSRFHSYKFSEIIFSYFFCNFLDVFDRNSHLLRGFNQLQRHNISLCDMKKLIYLKIWLESEMVKNK